MPSNINTIKQKLLDRVKEKYPHITPEQVEDEIDYYFKYIKQQVKLLPKPEITVGIVGRLVIVQSKLETGIKAITKILENPKLADWQRERLTLKLDRLHKLHEIKKDIYDKGKTYKATRRKRKDGRLEI